jgi:predicted SnoaL-like aldol condensation-catalyzing enzyme
MSPARMSRLESGMRIVLAFNEAFNRHDIAGMMRLLSDNCRMESSSPAPGGAAYSGKQAITQFFHDFFLKSPNAHSEIEDIFGFGYRCVMRWKHTWSDSREKKEYIRGVDIFQIKDGLICEKLSYVKA